MPKKDFPKLNFFMMKTDSPHEKKVSDFFLPCNKDVMDTRFSRKVGFTCGCIFSSGQKRSFQNFGDTRFLEEIL